MAPSRDENQGSFKSGARRRGNHRRYSKGSSSYGKNTAFLGGLLVLLILCGCLSGVQNLYPPSLERGCKTVFVVNHGWHTGIIVEEQELALSLWQEKDERPAGEYIEFGWGDARFYQAQKITVGLKLRAILFPTGAVLHVVGLSAHPRSYYEGISIMDIRVSREGLQRLIAYLRESYARTAAGKAVLIGSGLQENSLFYEAEGTYSVLNTCNNWAAGALRATGFPITPGYAMTTGNLVYQVKRVPQPTDSCDNDAFEKK